MRKTALMAALGASALCIALAQSSAQPIIGLITKTDSNPFFVKMKEGAEAEAKKLGAKLLSGADKTDGGVLIGKYAKAAMGGKKAVIAAMDYNPGQPVGILRHNGFLAGFGMKGITAKTPNQVDTGIVCSQNSFGDQAKGQTAMENCLQKNPNINMVYTINEPAAAGAYQALKAAGKEKGVIIVSVDGGCEGIRNVQKGVITATSQQYPLKMAAMGVAAGVEYAKSGKKVSGYTDTGVTLIAKRAYAGVASQNAAFGLANCWGTK